MAYYSYNQYQCQTAKERYEKAVGTLDVSEVPRYLIEYRLSMVSLDFSDTSKSTQYLSTPVKDISEIPV